MVGLLLTELEVLWVLTAGILLVVLIAVAVVAFNAASRSLTVVCLLIAVLLVFGTVLVFGGYNFPKLPLDRVQLLMGDILVMAGAIIVGGIAAGLVLRGGRRQFKP